MAPAQLGERPFSDIPNNKEAIAVSEEEKNYSEGDFTQTAVIGLVVVIVTFGMVLYCALTNPALDTLKY
jgi:hypothetical protein